MRTATMREAQHHLAKLVKEVQAGEEIVLTNRGVKTAKIVPYEDPAPRKITMPDFRAMQKRIGTDTSPDGVNEVLYLRELDDER